MADVSADRGGVELELPGQRRQPHRAVVLHRLEDGERGEVDLVLRKTLPHPTAESDHRGHHRLFRGGGLWRDPGRLEGRRCLHQTSISDNACATQVVFRVTSLTDIRQRTNRVFRMSITGDDDAVPTPSLAEIEGARLSLIHISEPTRRTPISYA